MRQFRPEDFEEEEWDGSLPEAEPIAYEDVPSFEDAFDIPRDESHVPPELRADRPLPPVQTAPNTRNADAARLDRKRQAAANVREYLRAAFTRGNPQLRNVGTSHSDAAKAEMAAQPKAVDPMERELMAFRVKKAQMDAQPKADNGRDASYNAYMNALTDRVRREPVEKQPKVVDDGMRDAIINEKNARADYLRRPRGSSASGEGVKLTATAANEFADFDVADQQLVRLQGDFKRLDVGGKPYDRLAAWGTSALKLNNDYSAYADSANRAIQVVGKILEGGKLAEGDMTRYRSLLPESGDSMERLNTKISGLRDFLAEIKSGRVKFYKLPAKAAAPSAPQEAGGAKWRELPDGSWEEVE